MSSLVKVNVTVDLQNEEQLKKDSLIILSEIRPTWSQDSVNWRVFTDGITNKLVGAWHGDKKEDTVLIRVYGLGTEKIIDRKMEMVNMMAYQKLGGSTLYATFTNGICYQFIAGDLLSQDMVFQRDVYLCVARGMAMLHTLNTSVDSIGDNGDTLQPVMWTRLKQFIDVCNPSCSPRLKTEWMTKEELLHEAQYLQTMLKTSSSPVVFCHNDALLGNIVLTPNNNSVTFIDLEYGAPNYAAFDIANHFCEFVGCDGKLDYKKWLPSREYQLEWIEEYLTCTDQGSGTKTDRGSVSKTDVESMYQAVSKFMLCAHLQWSIWSVIQAENSSLDFDFVDYAIQRYEEYNRWKQILKNNLI